jgi:hypothetical protein
LDRKTVGEAVPFSIPTGYRRKAVPTARKSGPFVRVIDQILEADRSALKKQRHTSLHVRSREMFTPAAHRASDAQADFGQADIYLNGAKTRIYLLPPGPNAPRRSIVKTDWGETTEAFLEGYVAALAWLQGISQSIFYDNTTLAAAKIPGGASAGALAWLRTAKPLPAQEPVSATSAELQFVMFSRRYENGATLVASNMSSDEWTSVFGAERLAGALLDRLTHRVHILEMNSESYRLATFTKTDQTKPFKRGTQPQRRHACAR